MPFVSIRLVREAIADDPEGKKAKMGKEIAKTISETIGLAETDVWIVFEEVAARDWYLGTNDVETLRFKDK
jgi:4-oxalocrotonate tautomerase